MLLLCHVKIVSDKTLKKLHVFPVRRSQNNVPTMIYVNRGSGLICLFLAYTEERLCVLYAVVRLPSLLNALCK